MLLNLRIENFALIDALELQFGSGLNVLTGETGAGKSIILDAIDAALGGKVSSRVIRTGTERSLIEATFQLTPSLAEWLERNEIDRLDEASLICSRELSTAQGHLRSRSRLNGVLVNKQQMEDLRDHLVEITAQGQTVQLGQSAMQRQWLDSFVGEAVLPARDAVAISFTDWHQTQQAIETRRHSEHQRLQRLDMLRFQVKELRSADLTTPDELDSLEQERQRLSHSVELQQQSYQAYQALYQNEQGGLAAADLLGKAENTLADMLRYDAQVQPILDLVSAALAQVEEAGREISRYGDSLETDPERLQTVEERIVQLKQICRKYGPTLQDAIAHYQIIDTELSELTAHDQSLAALEQISQQQAETLQQASARLTLLRKTAAQTLQSRLIEELKPLAMEKVQFQVEITPCPPAITGADRITFLFSPNPGEPLQPLTEIASGGEMSRFLLALKTCFVGADVVGTLVFDEIDVGVSGRVTQAIAQKLHQLSQHHQVLCVTHQAIVAAMADQHFRVNKQVTDTFVQSDVKATTLNGKGNTLNNPDSSANPRTVVRVTSLDQHQRRDELAQLAGGQSDQKTIAFADSLLAQAASSRQNQTPAASTQSKGAKRTRLQSKRKSSQS
jgi:DNA repair protein RecN (Recombination protein N)